MQRTIRVLFVLLFTTLGSLVSAEDIGVCKAGCDSAKKRCRSEADLKANAESYPPIQIDDGTINLDRKRDMRAVLEDRQRREDGQKKMRFERYQDCEHAFQQCSFGCKDAASSSVQTAPSKP